MTGTSNDFNRAVPGRLSNIFERLARIPEGQDILDFLERHKIPVRFDKKVTAASGIVMIRKIEGKSFVYGDCAIALNKKLSDDNILQALIHESQHMRQHLSGVGNPDFWPDDEDHCLLRRAQEADAQAVTAQLTYLLKLNGDGGPWEVLKETGYGNMAEAFERQYNEDPQSLRDGRAQRAAYDAWFDIEHKTRFYDRDTVQEQTTFLRRRLWDNPDHQIRPGKLTAAWLERMGALSPVNYMKLQGRPAVTDARYRKDIQKNIGLFPDAPAPTVN